MWGVPPEHRLQDNGLFLTTTSRPDFFASHTAVLHTLKALALVRAYVARYQAET